MDQAHGTVPAEVSAPTGDVFALTDEQIVGLGNVADDNRSLATEGLTAAQADSGFENSPLDRPERTASEAGPEKDKDLQVPQWLAERMQDARDGTEAKELWDGKQRAEAEVEAYREVFVSPADARALKELYPGGLVEAKSAAARARELDGIDAAFYKGDAAARAQLAQKLMQQDPTAFRAMVELGVKLLDGDGKAAPSGEWRAADESGVPGSKDSARTDELAVRTEEQGAGQAGIAVPPDVARAYGEFEKAANVELEKSVGDTISRVMEQALPNLRASSASGREGASSFTTHDATPLRARLTSAVREEVDAALRSDRELGEQVARILAGRRFDDASRAQVVRLIDARAQQLVPGAVRRVVGSWTQATLGPRGNQESKAASGESSAPVRAEKTAGRVASPRTETPMLRGRRPDYRKMSDEEILGM